MHFSKIGFIDYSNILSEVSDAVILTKISGDFQFICDNVHFIFKQSAEDMAKLKNIKKIIPEKVWHKPELKKEGIVQNLEHSLIDAEGGERHVLISIRRTKINDEDYLFIIRDVTNQKITHRDLQLTAKQLQFERNRLKAKTVAISALLDQIEHEKEQVRADVQANVREVLMPLVSKIKRGKPNRKILNVLESELDNLASNYARKVTSKELKMTPRELGVCTLIRNGLSTKEIAVELSLSPATIEKHRQSIRKKLGISNKKVNIHTCLSA